MTSAAGTPLPETSPITIAMRPSAGAEGVVEVAAHLLGRPVDGRQPDGLPGLGSATGAARTAPRGRSPAAARGACRGRRSESRGPRSPTVASRASAPLQLMRRFRRMGQMTEASRTASGAAISTATSERRGGRTGPGPRARGWRNGQAGRVEREDLHHGLAAGNGNDLVESLPVAEVSALLIARELPRSRGPEPREHAAVRPPNLDPQRLVGRALRRVRQLLEQRLTRRRRAPERLLQGDHVLAQPLAHLPNGEEPGDERGSPGASWRAGGRRGRPRRSARP